jgi:hypothetical protein
MMMPTAMSTTFPRIANVLKSFAKLIDASDSVTDGFSQGYPRSQFNYVPRRVRSPGG